MLMFTTGTGISWIDVIMVGLNQLCNKTRDLVRCQTVFNEETSQGYSLI